MDISNPGGLWDESIKLYPHLQGEPKSTPRFEWTFPNRSKVRFAHLEYDKNKLDWQGAQVPLVCFDELTHFEASQFWYLLSRNRSTCGVRPYVRCTTNPDADSWVAKLIAWWINQETGYAIPERSGVIRWFVRIGDKIIWADSEEELAEYKDDKGEPIPAKSLTFIRSSLDDNKKLIEADPGYRANLMALGTVERERLLNGNWKIRPAAGMYFKREWVGDPIPVAEVPRLIKVVRGWDLAATEETETNDPDWTCGTKLGIAANKTIYVLDHKYKRYSPGNVRRLMKQTAKEDGRDVKIAIPQDPGQAGKAQTLDIAKDLMGYKFRFKVASGDKIVRFSPFSNQCQAGNVKIVKGDWNERWLSELENFPPQTKSGHDDDADSTSEAFDELLKKSVFTVIGKYYTR